MEQELRLQKYLANNGIASRRKAEEYILDGKVRVNGKVITELGVKIDPNKDKIEFEGKEIQKEEKKVYILLNKPIEYVTTVKDQFDRNTVIDLVKGVNVKLLPVGRLDMYTSGAIILTNDGDFIYHVTHPKHEVEKTYNVTIRGEILQNDVKQLEQGVEIDNNDEKYTTSKAKVKILKVDKEKNISRFQIVIHEGKNRQVRKMCESIDKKVLALHRTKIGDLGVKNLKLGEWRYLNQKEVDKLFK